MIGPNYPRRARRIVITWRSEVCQDTSTDFHSYELILIIPRFAKMLIESLVVAAAVLSILRNLILTWANVNRFPKSIPWIGRRNQYFSRIRACGREVFGGLERMKAGYEEVSASPYEVTICDH